MDAVIDLKQYFSLKALFTVDFDQCLIAYIETISEYQHAIENSIDKCEWHVAKQAVHALQSSIGQLGGQKAFMLLDKLENIFEHANHEEVSLLLKHLVVELDSISDFLREELAKLD